MVTESKQYVRYEDFLGDTAQQSSMTEVYGLSRDTIVTHVMRNGVVETFTFRLPVITRTVNPEDGSVRVTSRYGKEGAVCSEVRDGSESLIQLTMTKGDSLGGVITYTQYPDSTWRNTRVIGRSDGSVFHEITSGP